MMMRFGLRPRSYGSQNGGIGGRVSTIGITVTTSDSMRRCLIWIATTSTITADTTTTDTPIDNATAINLGVIIYVYIVNY